MKATALGLELSIADQECLFDTLARKRNPSVVDILAMERLNNMLLNRERQAEWCANNPAEALAIRARYDAARKKVKSKKAHFLWAGDQALCGLFYPDIFAEDIKEVTCHSCRRRYNSGQSPS